MKTRNALLAAFMLPVLILFGAAAVAQDKGIDQLLPPDTLFYIGMDDFQLMEKYAETMPITKILMEEEVVDFFKKPKEYIDKNMAEMKAMLSEKSEELAAKLDSMMDLKLQRFFMAMTHFKLPSMDGGGAEFNPIPDVGLAVGFSLQGGVDPAPMVKGLLTGIAAQEDVELSFAEAKYNDTAYTKLSCPYAPEVPVYYFHLGDLFVITLSQTTMNFMIDCHTGAKKECLANAENYKKLSSAFDLPGAGSSQSYVDLKSMVTLLKQGVSMGLMMSGGMEHANKVDIVSDKLGLDSLGYAFQRGLSKDGVARSETLMTWEGEYKGLLQVFPCIPIERDDLAIIPKDVMNFSIFRFDLAAFYDVVMDVIKTIDMEVYQEVEGGIQGFSMALTMGTESPPINIREDIIGQLGKTAMMYTMGGGGGMMMMPSVNFFVEIKDYDKFVNTLKTIFEGLSNLNPEIASAVSLSTINFNDQDIHYFQFSEIPMMFTPCFTKAGNFLAVGMQIDDLKKLIKRQGGATVDSVLNNEDFAKLYKMLPEDSDLISISYTRTKESFSSQYNQLAMTVPMLTMALPPEIDLPLDLQLLPTAEAIEQHLFSSMTAQVLIDDHTSKVITYSPFGGECMKYLFPVLQLAGFMTKDYMMKEYGGAMGGRSIEADYEDVVIEEIDDEQFKNEKARSDMVNLSNGCFVYKIEFGEYPPSLEDLLKPTKDWPSGFYSEKELPLDPWGKPYHFKKLEEAGKNYMIWSSGPDCIDEGGEGDDIKKIK